MPVPDGIMSMVRPCVSLTEADWGISRVGALDYKQTADCSNDTHLAFQHSICSLGQLLLFAQL